MPNGDVGSNSGSLDDDDIVDIVDDDGEAFDVLLAKMGEDSRAAELAPLLPS